MPRGKPYRFSGKTFGRLTVLSREPSDKWRRSMWLCRCECGVEKVVAGIGLRIGSAKSCGCLLKERARSRAIEMNERLGYQGGLSSKLAELKKGAAVRGLEFALTEEEASVLLVGECFYCGSPPNSRARTTVLNPTKTSGVDRVDNKAGYTRKNSVSCCSECNFAKSKMSAEEFITMCKRVAHNQAMKSGNINLASGPEGAGDLKWTVM